jgi:chorismate mutase
MSTNQRLWAVRGAITITEDTQQQVIEASRSLLRELLQCNQINPADIVSVIFTVTPDICSEFPAAAARSLGLTEVPLMCAQEIAKPGAMAFCIRVLIHFYTELEKEAIQPVYLGEAIKLRPDLFNETEA